MNESIIIRATKEDKAKLKMAALTQNKSMSQLVRELLLEHGYIESSPDVVNGHMI